ARRHGDRHGIDAPKKGARVGQDLAAGRRGRARAIGDEIHGGDKRGARHARHQAHVMAAEMADADDRDAEWSAHDRALPTTTTPASSAACTKRSPSTMSVLPASIDRPSAPAAFIAAMVATPTTGTSNRMS